MNITTHELSSYTQNSSTANIFLKTISSEDNANELHRHDFYQIILITKGEAKHVIDFKENNLIAGDVSILFPKQTHILKLDDDAEALIIMFDSTVFCSEILSNELRDYNIDLSRKVNNVGMHTDLECFNHLVEIFYKLEKLYLDVNPIVNMQMKFFIKIIILKTINSLPAEMHKNTFSTDTTIYMEFREKVDTLFRTHRTVKHYADKLAVSTKKLTAVCQEYAGQTPLEIIHERLNLELKNLFVADTFSLKEITFDLGFSSQSALNKYIAQKFNCTPMELKTYLDEKVLGKINRQSTPKP